MFIQQAATFVNIPEGFVNNLESPQKTTGVLKNSAAVLKNSAAVLKKSAPVLSEYLYKT